MVEGLARVADKALLYPKVVVPIAIEKISVEVSALGAYGYGFTQFSFITCRQYAVYEVKHNRSYLVVKVKYHIFKYHVHIGGIYDLRHC